VNPTPILSRSVSPVVGLLAGLVVVLLARVAIVQVGDEYHADPRNAFVRGWVDTDRPLPTITTADGRVVARSVSASGRVTRRYFDPDLVPLVGIVPGGGAPVGIERWLAVQRDHPEGPVRLTINSGVQAAVVDAIGDLPAAILVLRTDGTLLAAIDHTAEMVAPVDDIASGRHPLPAGTGPWPRHGGSVLFDRPVAAGSTLKPLLFGVALDQGLVGADDELPATRGYQPAGGRWVANNHDSRCPPADLVVSLALSCNSTALMIADLLSPVGVRDAYRSFGLGAVAPSARKTAVSVHALKRGWPSTPDEVSLAAIGQGEARVTLLGLGLAYAAIATGEGVPAPRVLADDPTDEWLPAPITAEARAVIMEGLLAAVEDGTASGLSGRGVAAKTGTATRRDGRTSDGWVVTLVPAQDPEHVIITYLSGDEGSVSSADAVPLTARLLDDTGDLP